MVPPRVIFWERNDKVLKINVKPIAILFPLAHKQVTGQALTIWLKNNSRGVRS